MAELNVTNIDSTNEITMTSLEVVDLVNKFRLEEGNKSELLHKNFIASVRKEIEYLENAGIEGQLNFKPSSYINSQNKKQPCYIMTKSGIMQMLNKESAVVRYKTQQYIKALEERLNTPQISEHDMAILKIVNATSDVEQALAIKSFEKLIEAPLKAKIEEDKPKVDYFENFMNSNKLFTSTQVAKLYGLSSGQKLNKLLNENKIIYKQGKSWLPYAGVDESYYKQLVNEYGTQLKFTSKGVLEIAKIVGVELNEEDIKGE